MTKKLEELLDLPEVKEAISKAEQDEIREIEPELADPELKLANELDPIPDLESVNRKLDKIEEEGAGLLVYLRQEGRGIGLKNKIMAYKLQDKGLDTVDANHYLGFPSDLREYGIGAQIIRECGVRKMRLLTNNPRKIVGLEGYGLEVVGREPIEFESNAINKKYLQTKRDKLGHFILKEE